MRHVKYTKRASHRFLAGTRFRAPIEAVEAGVKTLEEWADILTEEREAEAQFILEKTGSKRSSAYRSFARANGVRV